MTSKKSYKKVSWLFRKEIEIPEEWNFKKLLDCVFPPQSGTWGIDDAEMVPDEYVRIKVIRNTEFKNWNPNSVKKSIYRLVKKKDFEKKRLKEGDILLETSGGGPKQPLARTILIDKKTLENSQNQASFSNFIQILRSKPEIKDLFLYYYLNYLYNQGITKNFEMQTTNLRNFDFKWFLKTILVPIPLFSEQQKIVSILSNVDNLIQNTDKTIQQTKRLEKGLMRQLLTKGIGHTKFKKVPWLFRKEIEIPEEWEIRKIDDAFEFLISGTNARSDLNDSSEIGYIHYGDIHTKWNLQLDCNLEKIPRIDKEKVSRLPLLKDGDLIIADASEDVEGSGTSILLKNVHKKKIVAGLHTLVLRSKDENISFEFMKYLTSVSHVKIQITSYVTGTKVFGLSKKSCKEIKVLFPELPEQQKIASILSNVDTKIQSKEQYKEKLQRLKKSLMQKLLTGEVRVAV